MKIARNIMLLFLVSMLLLSGMTMADEVPQTAPEEQPQETVGSAVVETLETENFIMDYCKFGHGEKTFVILPGLSIQSVMGSADAIAEAYQQFADDYTVYVFDRRQDLPSSYSVYELAQDTAAAFQTIGLEQICLFGASYGGMAAMVIAIQHPELIEKVVLASTSAALTDEEFQALESWIRLAEEGDATALYLAFGEALYPEEMYEQSQELLIDMAKTVTEEELRSFIIQAEGMKGFDVTDDLDKIQCPVLAIGDKQDRVLGAAATENIAHYMDQRSDFELYMYDGYGHAVYDTAPDFKERMLSFFRK